MYRIRWARSALQELAAIWNAGDADSRKAVTAASDAVERRLERDPMSDSESRSRGRRVTFAPPLTIIYRVERDGQTVSVLHVRQFRLRR
jgi:plasmid stabilization system protein ParE